MTTYRLSDVDRPDDGELVPAVVGGRRLVVLGAEGDVFALDEECTHQRCSLATGEVDGTTLVCPCHFAEFDVRTGEVLGGPAPSALATYAAQVVDGHLEIDVPE